MRVSIDDVPFPTGILIVDVDARQFIHGCIRADDETGEYTCYREIRLGEACVRGVDIDKLVTKKGNIRIVHTDNIGHLLKQPC